MINRRMRKDVGTESSASISSSGSLPSPKDFHEVKEVVKDISRRLELLEKIFVFVDIEQINHVLASFSESTDPVCKAGFDTMLAPKAPKLEEGPAAQQASLQRSDFGGKPKASYGAIDGKRELEPQCGDTQTNTAGLEGIRELKMQGSDWQGLPETRTSVQSALGAMQPPRPALQPSQSGFGPTRGQLRPLDPPKQSRSTSSLLQPSNSFSPKGDFLQGGSETKWIATTADLKVDLTSVTEQQEKHLMSTGSTTAFTSDWDSNLRSTGSTSAFPTSREDGDDEIDQERCNNFMKQALTQAQNYKAASSLRSRQAWIDKVSRTREKIINDTS